MQKGKQDKNGNKKREEGIKINKTAKKYKTEKIYKRKKKNIQLNVASLLCQ